jgi:hypothetical protein
MKTTSPSFSRFFNLQMEFAMSRLIALMFVLVAFFGGCALEPLAEETGSTPVVDAGTDVTPGPEGPQGPMGPRGPQGDAGVAGTNGVDGTSCTVGPHPSGSAACVLVTCGTTRQELCAPAGTPGRDGADGTSCTVSTTPEGNHILVCSDGTSVTWADGEMGPMGPRGPQGDEGSAGADGQDADPCSVRQNTNGTATMTCPDGTSVTWETTSSSAPQCVVDGDCVPRVPYCDGTTRVIPSGTCGEGTCWYTESRVNNSQDCRVQGTQCTRAADCRVATPYCDGTTLVSERAECDFGFCVRSAHSAVNTEICAVPPTGWHVEINVRDSRGRGAEVHLYHNDPHRNESADTYAHAPHTFRLSQIEACTWGVEVAVRSLSPSTMPWWGCDAGTPSKRDLEIRVGGRLVTPAFRPHDWSCSGAGEGNLYLTPAALGCP